MQDLEFGSDSSGDSTIVEAAAANVRRGHLSVSLSGRERELVVALAQQTRPVAVETLAQLLYPDRDEAEGSNSVKVYVYRLRRRVAADFVVWRDAGYAFGTAVQVDVSVARRLLDDLSVLRRVGWSTRERFLSLARGLRVEAPPGLLEREWYEPVARHVRRLGRDLAVQIGRDALVRGEHHGALRVGRELTYEDPCDEEAWELLIRAQLLSGQRPAAIQSFRYYEATLVKELQATPSAHVRELIGAPVGCESLRANNRSYEQATIRRRERVVLSGAS